MGICYSFLQLMLPEDVDPLCRLELFAHLCDSLLEFGHPTVDVIIDLLVIFLHVLHPERVGVDIAIACVHSQE